ncbi:tellurite resistance TerB family protein [Marinobacter sp. chi1]|uniref:Tellurite resistance TerB family protein n=1 Tax=Marinobacter suaedae TaxID=3057675 RepID=A0ABT8W3S8_9GAMM|nr:tellurite resistance TerB family protein [Marinobacter sp. chi1]MDO3722896.1 tellurite resistance TerB family protein [Marinobacter sp. chi1]
MNVTSILNEIMKQAQGASPQGRGSTGGGVDLGGMMQDLGKQMRGGAGSGGVDLKSMLGGGLLGMLLGSKRGRNMGGKAMKYGALAGIGALAWKAYQNYQAQLQGQSQSQGKAQDASTSLGASLGPSSMGVMGDEQGQPIEQLHGSEQEQRGLEILQAMILAARADGHIDENEQAVLVQEIEKLGADPELQSWVQQQLKAPLDARDLASKADSPQARREIYLVSAAMIDDQNDLERAWLNQLGSALQLEPAMAQELERQVQAVAA